MSKKQTYISYLENENGKMINFERWAYKKADTVLKALQELYQHPIYKNDIAKSKILAIYATPDGYNKENNPVIRINIEEFLKAI